MFSFYGYTPSGFHFEFGSGAIEIGEGWESTTHGKVSEWGIIHHSSSPRRTGGPRNRATRRADRPVDRFPPLR